MVKMSRKVVLSQKGKTLLIFDNYKFYKDRVLKSTGEIGGVGV